MDKLELAKFGIKLEYLDDGGRWEGHMWELFVDYNKPPSEVVFSSGLSPLAFKARDEGLEVDTLHFCTLARCFFILLPLSSSALP